MPESITAFDAIVLAVIVISAIMAFARGFLREVATLGSFIAAVAAAVFANRFFSTDLQAILPPESPPWAATAILFIGGFVVVYTIVAWFGHSLSKGIQGADGIGMMDHVAGLVFGVIRGVLALVFFVFLLNIFLDDARVPSFIQSSATYPLLKDVADYVRVEAEEASEEVQEDMQPALPLDEKTGQ